MDAPRQKMTVYLGRSNGVPGEHPGCSVGIGNSHDGVRGEHCRKDFDHATVFSESTQLRYHRGPSA